MGTQRRRDGRRSGPRAGVWLRTVRGAMVLSAVALTAGTIALSPKGPVSAATPPMTVSISPETARADVASSFAETYKANAALTNGTIGTVIPSGWTTPQTSNPAGPGYVAGARGTCASVNATPSLSPLAGGGTQITLSGVTCAEGARLMLDYSDADALKGGSSTFGPTTAQTSPSTNAVSIASPSVVVTAGPTTHFVLSSSSHNTTAGAPYNFVLTPEDAGGDVSSYSGTIAFSTSDTGSSTVLPPPTFVGGTHNFAAMLTTAGVQSITATDTKAVPAITGTLSGITVSPAATALLTWSNVSAVNPDPAGGLPLGSPLNFALTATDRYHNVTPGYAGRVAFNSSTDPSAVLPAAYTFAPTTDHGTHSFRFTPMKVGRQTYIATDSHTSGITGSTIVAVNIAVGPETTANLTGTAGTPFSQSFTATGSTGPVSWSAGNLPSWLSLNGTTGIVSGTPMSTGDFGPFTITATDSASPADTGSWSYVVQVGPGAQTITITSTAPSAPYYGGPAYTPTGTATSGLPVAFTADLSTSAVCTGTGTISFVGVGTCTVDANAGGTSTWLPAPQVQQSFTVSGATQTITFTSDPPSDAVVHGTTYTPKASATSSQAVSFKVDTGSTAVCSVSGGVVSFTSIGTCTIDALQPGNDDWLAAPEVQQSFAVSGAPQTISFITTAPSNAVVDGATYSPGATTTAPSLTVALTVDDLSSAQCSIDGNGEVHFDHVGVCIIDANQGGDNETWAAAPQVQQSFSVGQGTQTIAFTSPAPNDAAVDGATYAPLAATNAPKLSVTLDVDPASSAVCSMAADGTVTFTAIGTCTIDANQAGNIDWLPAAQVQQAFVVTGAPQTVTITSSAPSAPYYQGPTYTPVGTATSGLPVAFSADPSASAVCTGIGTISFVGVGTCTVDANQGGDKTTWAAAPQVQQSFSVGQGTQTIGFTSTAPSDALVQGPTYTPETTSTSASDSSAAPVILSVDGSSTAVCAVAADDSVSFTAIGTCTIDANQAANANWSAATQVQQSFSVSGAPQTITITSSAPDAPYDGGPAYAPTGRATSSLAVTFSADPSTSAVCTGTGTISFVGVGTCTVDANQGGDGMTYAAAPQVQQSFSVSGGVQTLSFTSTAPTDAVVNGSTYKPTASTTAPRLSVALTVDPSSTAFCSMAADGTVSFTGIGTCTIDANQGGGSGWLQATQVQQSFAVSGASQTITFTTSAPTNAVVGGTDYSPGAGTTAPGLTVSFTVDGLATSVCSIDGNGNVSFTHVGVCIIDANQGGDGVTWAAAAQLQQSFSVGAGAQTISFTSSAPSDAVVGATYLPMAGTTAPGLTVALRVDPGAGSVCSMAADGTVSFTSNGTCTIDANQLGDNDWLAAPEVQQSFSVSLPYPQILIDGDTNPQVPTIPPDPGTNSCPAQKFPDGGCQINDLDGTVDNYFAATVPGVPGADVSYHWQIFYPPIFGIPGVVFSDAGIEGYNSQVLHILAGSLPQLVGDKKAGGDPYWRVLLTTTVNGVSTQVWYRFIYDSNFPLDFSTNCQLFGQFMGLVCWVVASQLLPSPGLTPGTDLAQAVAFTSSPPTQAVVGGPSYTPTASVDSGLPLTYSIDPTAASVCSMAGDGSVTYISAGTCTIDAYQPGSPDYVPTESQQSFPVGVQTISFTSAAPLDVPVGGPTYVPVAATTAPGLPVSLSVDPSSGAVCSMSGGVVSFIGAGTCRIDAQAGDHDWLPVTQHQSFEVGETGPGAQTITFTSQPPLGPDTGGAAYTPEATSTSAADTTAQPVTFSVDGSTSSVCRMNADDSVSFTAAGTCTVDANQAGDAYWSAAAQLQQSFTVTATLAPTLKVNVDYPQGDPQNPVLPPSPAASQCAPQTVAGGGCTINALDADVVNEFDAGIATDPNPNPAEDTTTYSWQLFDTSGKPIVPLQPTVFTTSQLLIPAGSLSGDIRVELTATTNGGPATSVFFSFALNVS